jgi:hypothetical protein
MHSYGKHHPSENAQAIIGVASRNGKNRSVP